MSQEIQQGRIDVVKFISPQEAKEQGATTGNYVELAMNPEDYQGLQAMIADVSIMQELGFPKTVIQVFPEFKDPRSGNLIVRIEGSNLDQAIEAARAKQIDSGKVSKTQERRIYQQGTTTGKLGSLIRRALT